MYAQALRGYELYIRSRQLIKEEQVMHYSRWVAAFLHFAATERIRDFQLCLMRFLQDLERREGIRDWQLGQAKNAVHIYYYQFRKHGEAADICMPLDAIDPGDFPQVREKALAVLRLKNYAYRTEETYLNWMTRFYNFLKKNRGAAAVPESTDVRNFITYLALTEHVSASTQNQAFNALLFMCRHVIGLELADMDKNIRAKRGRKLPLVLSIDEVRRLIQCVPDKHRLAIKMIYGGGLRLMDLVRLRVKDIDFDHGLLIIREGKGEKDRTTLLPETIYAESGESVGLAHEVMRFECILPYCASLPGGGSSNFRQPCKDAPVRRRDFS